MPGSAPRASFNNPYGPLVTFRTEDVLPPSAVYISMNDTVAAVFLAPLAGTSFTLVLRILLPDGTIQIESYNSTAPISPLVPNILVPPVEGYLLGAVIERNDVLTCSTWVSCALFKGAIVPPLVSLPSSSGQMIMQGEVMVNSWLAWPNSPVSEAGTGAGAMRTIPLTVGAGTNWFVGPPVAARWDIIAAQFAFQCSAAAGARLVGLWFIDGAGNSIARAFASVTQAPSTAVSYYFFRGASPLFINGNLINAPMPIDIQIEAAGKVESAVFGLDAGDTWGSVTLTVKEWVGVSHG